VTVRDRFSAREALTGTAVLIVVLTGCSAEPGPEPELSNAPGNVATYVPVGEGGNMALLEGRVYQTDPCIAVEDRFGTQYVPVFPVKSVTSIDGVPSANGVLLVDGADVSLAGGWVPNASDEMDIPEGCDGDLWIVSQ
jgi:hypothetical protein